MSQRELRSLGVTTETSENTTMAEGAASTVTRATTEVFTLSTSAGNINPSSTLGGELYLKATEELPEGQKIRISLTNGLKVRDALSKNRSNFAWVPLLSKVPNSTGDLKDTIKNHRALVQDEVLCCNNAYLRNSNLEAPMSD